MPSILLIFTSAIDCKYPVFRVVLDYNLIGNTFFPFLYSSAICLTFPGLSLSTHRASGKYMCM